MAAKLGWSTYLAIGAAVAIVVRLSTLPWLDRSEPPAPPAPPPQEPAVVEPAAPRPIGECARSIVQTGTPCLTAGVIAVHPPNSIATFTLDRGAQLSQSVTVPEPVTHVAFDGRRSLLYAVTDGGALVSLTIEDERVAIQPSSTERGSIEHGSPERRTTAIAFDSKRGRLLVARSSGGAAVIEADGTKHAELGPVRALAFDPQEDLTYALSNDRIAVIDHRGVVRRTYALPFDSGDGPVQLAMLEDELFFIGHAVLDGRAGTICALLESDTGRLRFWGTCGDQHGVKIDPRAAALVKRWISNPRQKPVYYEESKLQRSYWFTCVPEDLAGPVLARTVPFVHDPLTDDFFADACAGLGERLSSRR